MEQRHIQMIALAGTLGTGLFLSSGKVIAHGGPVGAVLAYILTGSIAYCMCEFSSATLPTTCLTPLVICVGEMAVYAPVSGGYIHFIERWWNPSVGFAVGIQVCFQYCLFLPSEIIAANILISYWDKGEFPAWGRVFDRDSVPGFPSSWIHAGSHDRCGRHRECLSEEALC
jgi:amino acid transporter